MAERGGVLSRVKSRVPAMLAPKRGLRVAAVPPLRGGFDPACARLPMEWQVGTKEQVLWSNQGTSIGRHYELAGQAIGWIDSVLPSGGEIITPRTQKF